MSSDERRDRIVVVGHTGRVGRAVTALLDSEFDLIRLSREAVDPSADLGGTLADADGLLNLAGRAHVTDASDPEILQPLYDANVALPRRLAEAAGRAGVRFVHLSSTKADVSDGRPTLYGMSKAMGEAAISEIVDRGSQVEAVSVRTPAVLAPPFDAGNLARLRKISRSWPIGWVPDVEMPAVTPLQLTNEIRRALLDELPAGHTIRSFERGDRSSLREVVGVLHGSERGER